MLDNTKRLKPLTFSNFPPGVSATPTQLAFSEALSVEDWQLLGSDLGKTHSSSQWWLGDWWNHGEAYGERVEIARSIGLHLPTIREYARVCKNVSIRIETLEFAKHQVVASLEPKKQERYLKDAAQQGWSVSTLRQKIHQGEANSNDPEDSDEERAKALADNLLEALHQAKTNIKKYQFPDIKHLSWDTIDKIYTAGEELTHTVVAVTQWARPNSKSH
jgi:hypothetical protein